MTAASSSAASRITVGEPADAGARSCARVADVAAVGSDAACAVGSEVMDAGVSAVASVVISVCSDAATSVVSAVVSAASVCVVPASSPFYMHRRACRHRSQNRVRARESARSTRRRSRRRGRSSALHGGTPAPVSRSASSCAPHAYRHRRRSDPSAAPRARPSTGRQHVRRCRRDNYCKCSQSC